MFKTDPSSVSPEVLIMTRAEFRGYRQREFTRGFERGRREQAAATAETVKLRKLTDAATDVLAERERQPTIGWTLEHDDAHTDGSLAQAAAAYALNDPKLWPINWSLDFLKPRGFRRNLVKAAALLIAEIERLDRAARCRDEEQPHA